MAFSNSTVLYHTRKYWFILSIVLCISLAYVAPGVGRTGGILKPEVTVKYLAVSLIFINSGLSINKEDLVGTLKDIHLHVYIQVFTLLAIPVAFACLSTVLETITDIDPWLLKGLVVVGAMPPPVSSAVLLTRAAGGNQAAAIFNSAFGSLLGVLVTPAWLFYFLGSRASVSVGGIILQLGVTVLLPLLLGQLLRGSEILCSLSRRYSNLNNLMLLLIIYTTFCDTFSRTGLRMDGTSLIFIIILVVVLQLVLMAITFTVSRRQCLRFEAEDVVCCVFCSTHKSLTLGLPILKTIYANHPMFVPLSVPLLVYHPVQILLGSLVLPAVAAWRQSASYRIPRYHRVAPAKKV